jgi:hypothetical protein
MSPAAAKRSGFALLMALALVMLAGALMIGVVRQSASDAVRSRQALADLQRRWGQASLQNTILPRAEQLLDEAERGAEPPGPGLVRRKPPVRQLRLTCTLAELDYEVIVTDEQAKVNVAALVAAVGPAQTAQVVSRLAEGRQPVVLRPTSPRAMAAVVGSAVPAGEARAVQAPAAATFAGYGQVWPSASPADIVGLDAASGLAADLTCWGNGRLNIRRASAQAVREACARDVSADTLGMLLAARDRNPYRPLDAMLAELITVDPAQKKVLSSRLTDRSNCHGVWVVAQGAARRWYSLGVSCGSAAGAPGGRSAAQPYYRFDW